MEGHQHLIRQTADLRQQPPAPHHQHQIARQDQHQEPLAASKPGINHLTDWQKKVEVDRPDTQILPGDITRHAFDWILRRRDEDVWTDLGTTEEISFKNGKTIVL